MRGFLLSHQDSNLGKQNQNLMCYHYTMGHSKTAAKVTLFRNVAKFILFNAYYQRIESMESKV